MPIATDSGYLPDWLQALLGQGQIGPSNAPAGLFSETAASPSPNIGLLSGMPQFTGVQPSASWMGGSPEPPPEVPAQFTGVRTDAPWMGQPMVSNPYGALVGPRGSPVGPQDFAPATTSASYSGNPYGTLAVPDRPDVPLPPRRPNDLTSFQAQADPQDINAPPPGRPNANVIGTQASGAPEVTAQKSLGLGDYLGKAANAIGGIYGAGGPGDALIALGLSNRTGGASIQALNAMNANRASQANLALKQLDYANKIRSSNSSYQYLISKGVDPVTAQAATEQAAVGNTDPLKTLFQQYSGPDKYHYMTDAAGNPIAINQYDPKDVTPIGPQTGKPELTDVPVGYNSDGQPLFQKGYVSKGQPIGPSGEGAQLIGQPYTKTPQVVMQQESALQHSIGEAKGKAIGGAITAGLSAPKRIEAVDIIDEATKAGKGNVSSGPFAQRLLAGKEALGSALGIDLKGVPEAEVIAKTAYPLAAELSRTINSRGGTQSEFLKGLQSVPSLLVSDTGRTMLTSIIRQQAQQDQQLGKLADSYNPKTDGPWSNVVEKFYNDHPLKSPFADRPLDQSDIDRANKESGEGGGAATTAAPKFNWRRVGP
jgi:hypothetical protein